MIVLHNETYNPKIDYLICKQLVKTLPEGYDEDKIRVCFRDSSQVTEIYERDLINIKTFFEQNDILQITNCIVENLYKICTHEDVYINGDIVSVLQSDLRGIAAFVNDINCQRNALFQILFLLQYLTKRNSPVIPYSSLCNRLFYAVIADEQAEINSFYIALQKHVQKYLKKHTVEEGDACIRLFYEYADVFRSTVDAVNVGFYGSYARGNANEYSDFDILAVFSDEKDLSLCKRRSLEFWRSKLPIEVDVAVISQSNIDELPKGIKQSTKFV